MTRYLMLVLFVLQHFVCCGDTHAHDAGNGDRHWCGGHADHGHQHSHHGDEEGTDHEEQVPAHPSHQHHVCLGTHVFVAQRDQDPVSTTVSVDLVPLTLWVVQDVNVGEFSEALVDDHSSTLLSRSEQRALWQVYLI